MLKITNMKLEKEMEYDGNVVLTYSIEYPKIVSNNCSNCGIRRFNSYNFQRALELQNRAENELYNEAVELYRYNKENGYPIMVYEIVEKYNVTYNNNCVISLYSDEYIYTGGAHGNTVRTAQTWKLNLGRQLQLCEFFKENPYFLKDIFNEIIEQIQKDPDIYFDDYCTLMLSTFNPESFYLTDDGLVIYYGQYDIAPYSSGIREFQISIE